MSFLKNHIDKLYFGFCVTLVLVMFFYIFESQVSKKHGPTLLYGDTVKVEKTFRTGMSLIPVNGKFIASPCDKEEIKMLATDSLVILVSKKDTVRFFSPVVNPLDDSELMTVGKGGRPVIFVHVYLRDSSEQYLLIASPIPPYILLSPDSTCFTLPDNLSASPDKLSSTPQIKL